MSGREGSCLKWRPLKEQTLWALPGLPGLDGNSWKMSPFSSNIITSGARNPEIRPVTLTFVSLGVIHFCIN